MILKGKILKHLDSVQGIVHVGAHKKEEAPFYEILGVPVVWIEAEDGVVISDHNGTCLFYRASNGASSSILKPRKHLDIYPKITFAEPLKVKCETLQNYLERTVEDLSQYNFLNMDIQGAELMALKGVDLDLLDYIYTEVNTDELYEGCALLEEMDEYLSDFDRVETYIYDWAHWGDALYKRKQTTL